MIKYICDLCKKETDEDKFIAGSLTIASQPIELLKGLEPPIYDICKDCKEKIRLTEKVAKEATENIRLKTLAKELNLKVAEEVQGEEV